jgi:signal transduction histidine kinase
LTLPRASRLSFSSRLFLLVFVLQLVSAALLALVAWQLVQGRLEAAARELGSELHAEYQTHFRTTGRDGLGEAIGQRLAEPSSDDLALLLVDSDGKVLAGNLADWPPVVAPDGQWQSLPLYRKKRDEPELIGLIGSKLGDGSLLLTGHVIEDQRRLLVLMAEVLAVSMALAAGLAGIASAFSVRMVNQRIGTLVETSEAVAAGRLDERVPSAGNRDPFERLGAGMNIMLERLERLVTELRLVTDGMAHDLRMPLMRLRANIENAGVASSEPAVQQPLASAEAELERLLRIVGTALEIGRIESGIGRERFVPVPLDEVLEDLAELYGPVAEDAGFMMRVQASPPLMLMANRQLLSQALGNLIENALKYAGGGILTLSLGYDTETVQIAIEDRGPGIADADRERALRRFGRLDPARQESGAGLGLALVETVARLHGGSVTLEDARPGLRVVLSLPLT